ncbi:putative OB-fold protein [Aeromicrobium panaciterrae]|uniref:OB-fold protein n=1 Tax=Aeromicrobium panaciterrae TaxID=363861 RepID=A0ABU1UJN7_9ACTN|nr:OB-fold domain-containing protein [Aeromicrobium panaciterrae]MDR7085394.1 putative OB-fold protein [Aeromicrobium panaciterrae]
MTDPIIELTDKIKARGKSPARLAPDPVNGPMIRHWAEAIGDTNPRWAPGPDTEAPPAMAQVWTMYGLNPERMPNDPLPDTMQVLDDAGFTSVLGTNCDQTYARTLKPGEVPSISTYLSDVMGPKKTGVGEGYFITTKSVWTVGDEEVATMTFRVLKFKPGTGRASVDKTKSSRPMMNKDTSFFWEGTQAGELRIQKCNACGELRHPPGPVCPKCHAMDRGFVVASGKGTVRSFLVHHAPVVPGKQLPLTLALVDLEEGVRMIGEVKGDVAIGDAVEVWFDPIDDEVTLAKWQPAGTPAPEPAPEENPPPLRATLREVPPSDIPVWEVPITPTLVVSTALATRDFQDVHHDRDRSIGHGSKDIFINILSTTGLVQRYITDWAGPQTQILSCALRLGAPAYPYDTLRFTGNIVSEEDGVTTIDVTAAVSIGNHANARLEIRK